MCPPILLAAVGTAVSAVGSIAAGQAAKSQADAQAKVYTQQAVQEVNQGQYQAQRKQEEGNQILGRQNALTAGSGVTNDGSPTDAASSIASSVELDRSAILYGADVRAKNLKYQADLSRVQGRNAMTGAYLSAAGNVFGGLGQMGKMWDPNCPTSAPLRQNWFN